MIILPVLLLLFLLLRYTTDFTFRELFRWGISRRELLKNLGIVILSLLQKRGLWQVSLVLIVLGWPTMLRLLRSAVLSAKEQDYVDAARALGASDFRIITRHILPNAMAPVIVYATITVGVIISAEAALSFLGVGLQLPAISWGLMIAGAQTRILNSPHLLLFPGAFLSMTVFSFILMGDALRDALDPKLR
jgi:ABC-type dipeptide/oligopeptide/nickel transport system permease subunit